VGVAIGRMRSGRPISIPIDPSGSLDELLADDLSAADRFDIYCAVTYLRAREHAGWRLTPDDSPRFDALLTKLLQLPAIQAAIQSARAEAGLQTVFDHLRHGRALVSSDLRA
jgi:hypothetical protein